MQIGKKLDFLLGATSPGGFAGYFDQLQNLTDEWRLLLVKAGPGCGKSTLIKKTAEHLATQGNTVELIHCSSDPDSLDGVIAPERKFAIVDATAPHTMDPRYPVAFEEIVSLYPYMSLKKLSAHRSEVVALFKRCNILQERAARYITAASSLINDSMRAAACALDADKAHAYGERLSLKFLPTKNGVGTEDIRMLSAMTLQGELFYRDTVSHLATDILILEDEYGAVAKHVLKAVRDSALKKGYRVISCYCPMSPYEKLEHVIVPEAKFAVVTSNSFHPLRYEGHRIIHCERFCDKVALSARHNRLKFNRKAATELIAQASALQREAKSVHDQIELFYVEATDFAAIDKMCDAVIATLS